MTLASIIELFSGDEVQKILFLDRDGTLIENTGYLHQPGDVSWKPGVLSTLKVLQILGWEFVVMTNQSGIARGKYQVKHMNQVHDKMRNDLLKFDIEVNSWQYCPHHPDFTGPCSCRKPEVGMILNGLKCMLSQPAQSPSKLKDSKPEDVEQELRVILRQNEMLCAVVGDHLSDVEAGIRAQMSSFLIGTKPPQDRYRAFATFGELGQFLIKTYGE